MPMTARGVPAMAKLVQFTEVIKNDRVFINPSHVRVVIPRSDGGTEIILDGKIFFFVTETLEAVVKALDNA